MPSLIAKSAIASLPPELSNSLTVTDETVLDITVKMPIEQFEVLCSIASDGTLYGVELAEVRSAYGATVDALAVLQRKVVATSTALVRIADAVSQGLRNVDDEPIHQALNLMAESLSDAAEVA